MSLYIMLKLQRGNNKPKPTQRGPSGTTSASDAGNTPGREGGKTKSHTKDKTHETEKPQRLPNSKATPMTTRKAIKV